MIAVGYMAKRVAPRPDWLDADQVESLYSVSTCFSQAFADFVDEWKHNGYWLFDSPQIILEVARRKAIDLTGTALFFYECHERGLDEEGQWRPVQPEPSFVTQVVEPTRRALEGFDVVTFSVGTSPECSPLSCNGLASEVETNRHCLLPTLERAKQLLEEGRFQNAEPGPYRIFAVYSTDWP